MIISAIYRGIIALSIILVLQIESFAETKRCLFIGDSYFSHNDLSNELLTIWNGEVPDTLLITNHNINGATIVRQWEIYSDTLRTLLASQNWDYLIVELPRLVKPDISSLIQILQEVDASLHNCRIICINMDFCINFPEMACSYDPIEGIRCNEFNNCKEKLNYVKTISDSIEALSFHNSLQIIPFSHFRYFLYDKYSIELTSDDEYGHPSYFSQSVLARLILFNILYNSISTNDKQNINEDANYFYILSFYKALNDEIQK